MDVRCGGCNKLFRVSDDKVIGSGIRFKCTRCGEYVAITREAFDEYSLSQAGGAALPMPEPPAPAAPKPPAFEIPSAPRVEEPVKAPAPPSLEPSGFDFRAAQPEEQGFILSKAAPGSAHEAGPPLASAALPEVLEPSPAAKAAREQARPSSQIGRVSTHQRSLDASGDTIHPFASGPAAGIVAGLGCALPVLAVILLAFSIITQYVPLLATMPIYHVAAVSAAGLISIGILIALFLAMLQSWAERKMFSFLGIILGALFGAALGAGHSASLDLISRAGINQARLVNGAIGGGIISFLVVIPLVIIRRTMLTSKKESFSARLSGGQIFGFLFALAIIGFALYGEFLLTAKVQAAAQGTMSALMDMSSTEGLKIINPSGYMDTNGDLVITGTVENAADKEKPVWYLVAEVYDARNTVIIKARMMNGKQLYTQRDYDILVKRGSDVQDLKAKSRERGPALPPKGMMNFEIRIMEPPVGIATFNAMLRQFDPMEMMKEAASEMKQRQ
ncbi:MAG: zinc-ribbon domain-containing protein [Nitrospirota bacterium]